MKICYCLAGTFNSGGMERVITNKANYLARKGYQVVIITTEQKGRPSFFSLHHAIRAIDLDINYSEDIDLSFASDFSLSGGNRELVKGQFHCSDLFVV